MGTKNKTGRALIVGFIRGFYGIGAKVTACETRRFRSASLGALLLAMLVSSLNLQAQTVYYVRSGAIGNHTGTDWINAYTALPASLVRGATYYIAGGTYPAPYFHDADSGTRYITIQKATAAAHGTDTGWDSSYGTSVANWATNIVFAGNYYVFNGVTGGGPGSWKTGHGFKIQNTSTSNICILLSDKWGSTAMDVSHITISHVEMAGYTNPPTPGDECGINGTAWHNGHGAILSDIHVDHCYIHDIGAQGFTFTNVSNLTFEYNQYQRGATSPTHHGCAFRLDIASNVIFRYNMTADFQGTGGFGVYTGKFDSVELYGNVFYCTSSSACGGGGGNGMIYSASGEPTSMTNFHIYNNSFVNWPTGNLIAYYEPPVGTTIYAYNNLSYNIGATPYFYNVTAHDYNWWDRGVSSGEAHGQNGTGRSPLVDWMNENFHLAGPTNAGMTLASPYNTDPDGNTRGTDGIWDRGAFEYMFLSAPANLRIIKLP